MEGQRSPMDIVDRFKDEDIDSWPESVRGDAVFAGGYAYFLTKNGEAAVKDLTKAVEYLTDGNSKGLCLNCLGDAYSSLLKNDPQAIAAYRKTYGTGNVYKHCQAAMSIASILNRQGKHGEAVQELGQIKLAEVTAPYWRGRMLRAKGAALAASGRKADAISRYREALSIEGLPGAIRTECDMALKRLTMNSN